MRIGFVERRSGAGNGDADAVAAVENLAAPADIECELVDLTGFEQGFMVEAFAIAAAHEIAGMRLAYSLPAKAMTTT